MAKSYDEMSDGQNGGKDEPLISKNIYPGEIRSTSKATQMHRPIPSTPCHTAKSTPTPSPNESILEIVINSRPLRLGHTLLLPIHLRNLSATSCHIRLLIISNLDKSGEPQTDSFLSTVVDTFLAASFVARAESQVCGFDLPDVLGLEPDVGLMLGRAGMRVEGLGPVDGYIFELRVEFLQNGFREASADVTDSFVGVGGGVVAG